MDSARTSDTVIEGDLDRNLECDGALLVKRDLMPGFTVRAGGSITVAGVIRGSDVVAGKDVRCEGGIRFESKGRVLAKGSIRTTVVSRAVLDAGKSVSVAGAIEDSTVKAKETVVAGGIITGGNVAAMFGVTARALGSDGQAPGATKIEAGMNFRLKVMLEEMEKEVGEFNDKAVKIRSAVQALETKEKTHYGGIPFHERQLLKTSKSSLAILEKQLSGLQSRKQKLEHKLNQTLNSYVEVKERILPGTRVTIQHRFVEAQKEYPAGRYTVRNDKICRV